MKGPVHFRILLVDDSPAIHEDFRKILLGAQRRDRALEATEAVLFDAPQTAPLAATFEVESAYQGQEALEKVRQAMLDTSPYATPFALAFVDVRMPPGWDGIETVAELWKVDPALQVVICTAYSDYSWENMSAKLGASDNCVILKKPFDNIEVLQLAHALTKKWLVTQQAQLRLEVLEKMVQERTSSLEAANVELRRSQEGFAVAFRASPAPLAIINLEKGRFVDGNEAFSRMTGLQSEELFGRTPAELSLCISCPGTNGEPLREGERLRNVEAKVKRGNAEPRESLLSLERITIAGEPHLLLLLQDMSERLRLEAQLRQAQKMEAIGQLAAGIAHDFNNLLTIIQGHSSLQLSMRDLPRESLASLMQIEEAAERAAELTRQLLAFSRRQIMRPRVLNLSELVQKLSGMLRRLIGEQIELCLDLEPSPPSVCVDPTSIEQIVMNLVVNARDAMPKGGKVCVDTRGVTVGESECERNPEARSGECVRLRVVDTGVGMDDATRSRIFEPFFTTKEVDKGTGMGLATVYGLARQHEGWVEVDTAPGSGATFSVFLPVTDALPVEAEAPVVVEHGPRREHTILIVEDDEAVRALVKEVLVHHQYRVLEAEHAAAALIVWEEHADQIELLLTDIVMPGEANGLELSKMLLAKKPELKVVYTSGYSSELFGSDIRLCDGQNYLPKPYVSAKLTSIIRKALEDEEEPAATPGSGVAANGS